MPQTPWQQQIAYYRNRAAEYDATSYSDLARADRRMATILDRLRPHGDVLEIACGTGLWTRHLAACARSVTALDSAPEMIALARDRVAGSPVTFMAADVLDWTPPRRFDTVFFAFWLSHVPASAFTRFWSVVRTALTSDGRVLLVDDLADWADRETHLPGSGDVVERRLADGSTHRLFKLVRDPRGPRQAAGRTGLAGGCRAVQLRLAGRQGPAGPLAGAAGGLCRDTAFPCRRAFYRIITLPPDSELTGSLVISPDGSTVYVVTDYMQTARQGASKVAAYDVATGDLLRIVRTGWHMVVQGISADPGGDHAVVWAEGTTEPVELDLATGQLHVPPASLPRGFSATAVAW